MKKLFTAIRQDKRDEVSAILDKNPNLISCLAKTPPKKDDGQSPLMVAIKAGRLEVAHLLLDRGADVNFQDAPTQPYNESVPIWYLAVGQCFMRARDTVSQESKEFSKGAYELLCRLLDMGMDPNKKAVSDFWTWSAWEYALEQYDYFAHESHPSWYVETSKAENRQLQEMLKAVLDQLLAHGANIHDFTPPRENGMPTTSALLRNLEEGRELLDGFYGLESRGSENFVVKHRGREHTIQSEPLEEKRQRYETKWRELEPVLRAYYEKSV